MKVRKAIIPAAGLGTRFLPATKAQPKEMLPILDKPTIQYIVEEIVSSGIEDIIVITGRGKYSLEDHFDRSIELEMELERTGKTDYLEMVREIAGMAKIHYVRQQQPKGLGHAVLVAKEFIGDEPFAVLLGDDIVAAKKPCLKQLIEQYDKYQASILGVQTVAKEQVSKYGIIDGELVEEGIWRVHDMVEKPDIEQAPSRTAVLGRYVITPGIFALLETQEKGRGGEIQLTDALKRLAAQEAVYAYDFKGTRYDVGSKIGFLQANIEYALRNEEVRDDLKEYLERLQGNMEEILNYE